MFITYGELYDLINQSGFDPQSRDFYISFLNHVREATQLTEEERQNKYRILLNAIDAKNEAVYYNRWDVIIKDTIIETGKDIGAGLGEIVKIGQSPLVWIAIIAVVVLFVWSR